MPVSRADFCFIAGGVVPGVPMLKPDLAATKENRPFCQGQNEHVVNVTPSYLALVCAAFDRIEADAPGD